MQGVLFISRPFHTYKWCICSSYLASGSLTWRKHLFDISTYWWTDCPFYMTVICMMAKGPIILPLAPYSFISLFYLSFLLFSHHNTCQPAYNRERNNIQVTTIKTHPFFFLWLEFAAPWKVNMNTHELCELQEWLNTCHCITAVTKVWYKRSDNWTFRHHADYSHVEWTVGSPVSWDVKQKLPPCLASRCQITWANASLVSMK